MNLSPSQCGISGRSESGWTFYLGQSQSYSYPYESECHRTKGLELKEAEEEAEGLSMVSDASSGPPHFYEEEDDDDEYCIRGRKGSFLSAPPASESVTKKRDKIKKIGERGGKHKQLSYLEDTASSPVKSFSKKKNSISNGQASMQHYLKGSESYQRQSGSLRSSVSENPAPGGFWG